MLNKVLTVYFKTGHEGIQVAHGFNFINSVFHLSRLYLTLEKLKQRLPKRSSDGKYIKHDKSFFFWGGGGGGQNLLQTTNQGPSDLRKEG